MNASVSHWKLNGWPPQLTLSTILSLLVKHMSLGDWGFSEHTLRTIPTWAWRKTVLNCINLLHGLTRRQLGEWHINGSAIWQKGFLPGSAHGYWGNLLSPYSALVLSSPGALGSARCCREKALWHRATAPYSRWRRRSLLAHTHKHANLAYMHVGLVECFCLVIERRWAV